MDAQSLLAEPPQGVWKSLKRGPIVWTGHPRKGLSGRLGGEHQALWSSGPRERRCKK